jgi:hypothetical protein
MQDDTYIGREGKRWQTMSFPDAVDIITWIAADSFHADAEHHAWLSRNDSSPHDDSDLRRLGEAIITARTFNTSFRSRLSALKPPRLGTGWPSFVYADVPSLDASRPMDALRICLAAAQPEAIAPSEAERLKREFGSHIKVRSEDMVQSLIGLHGAVIAKWTKDAIETASVESPDARGLQPA